MKIRANDRVLLAGKTGSGKTWLAEHLLSRVERLVVIDSKANLGHWRIDEPSEADWHKFEKGQAGRLRLIPPIEEDSEAWYEAQFERLYGIGNLIVYIDEAYAMNTPGAKPGKWLTALYTRGRELGIGTWAATQRPAWIPRFLISEADILIIFRLNLADDRSRLADVAGDALFQKVPDPHGFFIYRLEDDYLDYYIAEEEGAQAQPLTTETNTPEPSA